MFIPKFPSKPQWDSYFLLIALRGAAAPLEVGYVRNWQERCELGRPLTEHMAGLIFFWIGSPG